MLARVAGGDGHPVTLIERPRDIRAMGASEAGSWLRGVRAQPSAASDASTTIVERSTLLPPHLNALAERFDTKRLASVIRRWTPASDATVVAMVPWQWPAVSSVRGRRRVLDLGDDWATLIPSRARRMRELYLRAAAEADEIVVVSEALAELFPDRRVRVVRNGVEDALLASSPAAPARARRIVYVGMLSERFDAPLVGQVLDRLPGWTAELYGRCAYRRNGSRPGADLAALLARADGRARWHGPVGRERLPDVLDRADVLLVPNRPHCAGQDSRKIYDYAARGRPIVATSAAADGISELPPHSRLGDDADELAGLICDAQYESATAGRQRIEWAAAQSWDSRWLDWSAALFGERQNGAGRERRLEGKPA